MKTYSVYSTRERTLTPREFLNLPSEERRKIKSVKILPPNMGKWGFGKFLVEYKRPIYEVSQKNA